MGRTAVTPAGKLTTTNVELSEDDIALRGSDDDVDANQDSTLSDHEVATAAAPADSSPATERSSSRWRRVAALMLVLTLAALAALVGWLTYRAHEYSAEQRQRDLFIQVGKQGAVNLTTIDWQQADSDVDRILDSSTGSFHDDFASRAQPFIEVVKQSKSVTVGTVTDAGIESIADDSAQILVAVTVKTSNNAAPEQEPRSWRMRVGVQHVGADVKVANVEFVP